MFKIGDIVRINPNWESSYPEKDSFGITDWHRYIGKTYAIEGIQSSPDNTTYFLTKDATGYFWPEYMLVPNKLKTLLKYKNLLKEN